MLPSDSNSMSESTHDKEKALQADVTIIPAVLGAEEEGQIRARLGRYGLAKLFDVGGVLSCPHAMYTDSEVE